MSRASSSSQRLHIVFVARSMGFPEGMAATNRVRLLGRALVEQGADVKAMCIRVSEHPGRVLNDRVRGTCEGIPFLYTPGSTVRSDSFPVRRWREARGYVTALWELARLRNAGRLDAVCLTDSIYSWSPSVWILRRLLRRMKVPVISQLNEACGRLPSWMPERCTRLLSHLDCVSGVIPISGWLSDWAMVEASRIKRRIEVIEIPIVVDVLEQQASPYPEGSRTFVYAASTYYMRDTLYLLSAMRLVWQHYPDCSLVVTGVDAERAGDLAAAQGQRPILDDSRIEMRGRVSRDELLALYRDAAALLVPLHDDHSSRARFPTKTGEYLAAARPVVTTSVGEIERYLRDGETAYVSPSDDVRAYAAKMIEAIDEPVRSALIGVAGRRLAEDTFQYSLHGARLKEFFEQVVTQR